MRPLPGGPILRLAFWAALVFAVVMALVPQPPPIPGNPSDKVLHVLAFAVLSALGAGAYPRARLLWLAAALSGVGAFIEFAQMIPALNRDAQLADWFADTGAIAIVLLLVLFVRHLVPEHPA